MIKQTSHFRLFIFFYKGTENRPSFSPPLLADSSWLNFLGSPLIWNSSWPLGNLGKNACIPGPAMWLSYRWQWVRQVFWPMEGWQAGDLLHANTRWWVMAAAGQVQKDCEAKFKLSYEEHRDSSVTSAPGVGGDPGATWATYLPSVHYRVEPVPPRRKSLPTPNLSLANTVKPWES